MILESTFTGAALPPGASVQHIRLNAFNTTTGTTFITDELNGEGFAVWVAMHVARSTDNERVYIWARRADVVTEGPGDSVQNRSFDLDFNQTLAVIGMCLNPMDPDDNDWGN